MTSRPTSNIAPRSMRSPNYAPSISSVISSTSTLVEPHQQRGFKSREAYLAALEEFAEGHLYMPTGDHTLKGFYGDKTMDFYKTKTSPIEDRRRRRKQEAIERERRYTLPSVLEDNQGPVSGDNELIESNQLDPNLSTSSASASEGKSQPGRRSSRFGKFFSTGRRETVV